MLDPAELELTDVGPAELAVSELEMLGVDCTESESFVTELWLVVLEALGVVSRFDVESDEGTSVALAVSGTGVVMPVESVGEDDDDAVADCSCVGLAVSAPGTKPVAAASLGAAASMRLP